MKSAALTVLSVAVTLAAAGATTVYETSIGRPFRQVRHVPSFSVHEAPSVPTLDLDAAKPSHPFKGLGVSFAEASCRVLMELPAAEREKALRMVFTDEGAGVSLGRIHVGCSDYSDHVYTYDDVMDDDRLEHFSIDPDRKYVIPVIKEAQRLNPSLYFFGGVWTPPAWMKLGRQLCGGWIDSRKLPVFCDYYVKFLQAYAKEGIKVSAICAQNEPCSDQDGESPECKWGPNEERMFAGELMPPRLKAAGLDTEIWLHDCEPHEWRQVLSLLDDPSVRANAKGVAWHSYGAWPEKGLGKILAKYPKTPMYHTEQGPHLDGSRTVTWWGEKVTRFLNAGCGAFTSWCLALDEDGRPNVSRGFNCAGFLEIDSTTGEVRPSAQWDFFRHIGPYVKRGAQVLATDYASLETEWHAVPREDRFVIAFRNPDGSVVIVVTNKNEKTDRKFQLQVKYRGRYASFQIPRQTVATIILDGEGEVRPTEVLVSFDTEDFTNPRSADGMLALANLCTEEGVTAQFEVVGLTAEALVRWGRQDVIDAIRRHRIGTHSWSHSVHPVMMERADIEDFETAYRDIYAEESKSVETVKRIFGVPRVWASVPPGNNESYVSSRVYADLGLDFDLGPTYVGLDADDIWYAGQRRIAYGYCMESFREPGFVYDADKLLDELAQKRRFALFCHPNRVWSKVFWDGLNYNGTNACEFGKWKLSEEYTAEETALYLSRIRETLRRIKNDPRFRIVTIAELLATQKPRVAIKASDLPAVRAALEKDLGPISSPASWCVADVFCAVVKMLAGERSYLPKNAYGFLYAPKGVTAPVRVTADELRAAAGRLDVSKFLPHEIEVGGKRLGPADFLFAGLEVLTTGVGEVTVAPREQLGSFRRLPLLEKTRYAGTWVHAPTLKDRWVSDRMRWQLWTFRYESAAFL